VSVLSVILPTIGQPDSTEDVKLNNALTAIQTWGNGNIDASNFTAGFLRNGLSIAWGTYGVIWSATSVNPVLGNGSLTGKYILLGKTVTFRIYLVVGSTTTQGTGVWSFLVPAISVSDGLIQAVGGYAATGAVISSLVGVIAPNAQTIQPWAAGAPLSSSSGVTTGNSVAIQGSYEIA
jgi:hypothetical protein